MKRTTHPIPDKAEVAVDFPDKVYMGSFSRGSKFEARAENDGLLVKLVREGEESRVVEIHLHHYLLADILSGWAETLEQEPIVSDDHRDNLLEALKKVEKAVKRKRRKTA
jgi:hypothetical protein